jgi:uncharacterized membrane protein YfcA
LSLVWEILIALAVGFVGGYSGVAGAPFIIVLLVSFLGYSQHSAQGTVLAMMLGPMTILPVIYGWKIVRRRMKEIITAVVTYMAFSFAGAEIAYLFSSPQLKLVFGACITIFGIMYLLFSIKHVGTEPDVNQKISLITMALIGALMGTVGGISGVGAGILLIPILTMGLRMEQHEAQTISLAILLPPVSLGAVVKYGFLESDVVWPAAGLMLVAYAITSGLGYKVSLRHSTIIMQAVLSALLILAGIITIIQVIQA